jgi:hypothetical protein
MRAWGQIFTIFSLVLAGYGMVMDTSLEIATGERILNLGLMNNQSNIFIGAGVVFISGILLIGFSHNSSGVMRVCPFCAENIKAKAKICRFCQKEVPELNLHSISEEDGNNSGWASAILKVLLFVVMLYLVNKSIENGDRLRDARNSAEQLRKQRGE